MQNKCTSEHLVGKDICKKVWRPHFMYVSVYYVGKVFFSILFHLCQHIRTLLNTLTMPC